MQRTPTLVAVLTVLVVAGALSKDQPQLTVEVLKAETVHWPTYLHDSGSAGKTASNCDIYDNSRSCTSTTQGARPVSTTSNYHTQVNWLVKMPDGNTVLVQCHDPPIWATCFQPGLGTDAAKINRDNIRMLVPVVLGKPKYYRDGTWKKPAKSGTREVKFNFR